jgi:hypothetical protein
VTVGVGLEVIGARNKGKIPEATMNRTYICEFGNIPAAVGSAAQRRNRGG